MEIPDSYDQCEPGISKFSIYCTVLYVYSIRLPEINRPYNEYKIYQNNCIVTGLLYNLTNEIPRIYNITAKLSGRLTAMHSGRLKVVHSGRETEVKSSFQSPIRIRTADLLARFRLARCVSNKRIGPTIEIDR
jgi:hypothetical protein